MDPTALAPRPTPARPGPTDEPAVTIYTARKVRTMDDLAPVAEAVAVQGERIYAVGSRAAIEKGLELSGREFHLDDRFADCVILPGFIESHSHAPNVGLFWQWAYVGQISQVAPDGDRAEGLPTRDAVVEKLVRVAAETEGSGAPIAAWGYDPALVAGHEGLTREQLDTVSATRPVLALNMSGHIGYVNSVVLEKVGYDASTTTTGVVRGVDGRPTGELQELAALLPAMAQFGTPTSEALAKGMWDVARIAQRVGATTITDMAMGAMPGMLAAAQAACADPAYPMRLSVYMLDEVVQAMGMDELLALAAQNHPHFRVAGVKFVLDGSIQGYTANVRWPYYYDGHPNGIANMTAESFTRDLLVSHNAGLQCAIHVNGDAATDMALDCVSEVLAQASRPDHRHRFEHNQMVDDDNLARMAALGVCTNLFANHVYYWGDFHRRHTLGPDRAARMNPLASAKRHGVRFSVHSDSWVTPIDPLHMVWTASTRKTKSGMVLGPDECISVDDALHAITIDSAWLLHEDHEKGSITTGKLADFAVLDADPSDDDPDAILDISVVATVIGGTVVAVGSF